MKSTEAVSADCAFCQIAAGKDQSAVVLFEGLEWLAFFPKTPATSGHTLVIPRRHFHNYWELDEATASVLGAACVSIGNAIKTALEPEGMNLISSEGAVAEQTVAHVHLHVLPRWADDAVGPLWPPKQTTDPKQLASLASRIRQAFEG